MGFVAGVEVEPLGAGGVWGTGGADRGCGAWEVLDNAVVVEVDGIAGRRLLDVDAERLEVAGDCEDHAELLVEFAFEGLGPGLAWFGGAAGEVELTGVRATSLVDQEDLVAVADPRVYPEVMLYRRHSRDATASSGNV